MYIIYNYIYNIHKKTISQHNIYNIVSVCIVNEGINFTFAKFYLSKQCAAVSPHSLPIIEAPQTLTMFPVLLPTWRRSWNFLEIIYQTINKLLNILCRCLVARRKFAMDILTKLSTVKLLQRFHLPTLQEV